jgi:uracil-DNA glycosylase
MAESVDQLQALFSEMKACNKCRLRALCKQVVPGEGPNRVRVAFFAEAPGETEDTEGRPLIGRAGSLFRQALKAYGQFDASKVFISNAVRCRPPDNREPSPDEKAACWEWTLRTLQIIRPKVVVTMGRHALDVMAEKFGFLKKIGQKGITKIAGSPIYVKERNFYVFPITHPSYAMRRNEARNEFFSFFSYLHRAVPGWLERGPEE